MRIVDGAKIRCKTEFSFGGDFIAKFGHVRVSALRKNWLPEEAVQSSDSRIVAGSSEPGSQHVSPHIVRPGYWPGP